jgi:hypothetical protein
MQKVFVFGEIDMKSQTRYVKKLKRKRVLICLLVFFALLPVFSYLHEAGHALVCIADGNEAEISVDIFNGGTTLCHGDHVSNLFAYKISGGLLAGIIGTTIGLALFVKKPFAGYSLESTRYNSWEIDGKVERRESRKRQYLDILWKAPFIALTTIGIGHLVNAGIETFADSYFTHGAEWGFFLGAVEFVTFITLLLIFDRKTVRRDRREMEGRGRTVSIRLLFGLSCIIVGGGLVVLSLLGVEFAR